MNDDEFRASMGGLIEHLVEAQSADEAEGKRQLEMLDALDRLKHIIKRSVGECFPEATEERCNYAALSTMVAMVEDKRLQVYLLPETADEV